MVKILKQTLNQIEQFGIKVVEIDLIIKNFSVLKKSKAQDQSEFEHSPVRTRRSSADSMARTSNCFFCDKDDTHEKLHYVQIDNRDKRVREYGNILQDRKLLGKLFEGDMYALGARLHLSCMTSLSNRVRKHNTLQRKNEKESKVDSFVLAELVSYIEEFRQAKTLPIFKLSDLGNFMNQG